MNSPDFYTTKEFKEILGKSFDSNPLAIPRIIKVVVNIGVGKATEDKGLIELAKNELYKITGQLPQETVSKKAISAFKLRKGIPIGCKVTLRGKNMNSFVFKLINTVLPRIRDFRGINIKNFDQHGNLNIGIREYLIFPEIDYDKVKRNFGVGINIFTTAKNTEQAKLLLENYGLIFEKGE
ncbi:MAG: 50S ribosomal protein L5 [bacterium]